MGKQTKARGGAKAATSSTKKALDRSAGLSATCAGYTNKTSSPYKGTGKHDKWEAPPSCTPGDTVRGY